MSFLVIGQEVAPSTGTPHLQIYLETTTKRLSTALSKKLQQVWSLNGPPHVEAAIATAEQNIVYCSKDKSYAQFGEPMTPGARMDLSAVIAGIAQGFSLRELWREFPEVMIKYSNGIRQCYQHTSPNLNQAAMKTFLLADFDWCDAEGITRALGERSVILWGDSGVGKSCFARALLPKALFVTHMDDLLQYDQGTHDGIIFDDIGISHFHREAQIHILDTDQPRSIHCRYQVANIPAGTKKIFTTNNDGGIIYINGDPALERRVEKFRMVARPDEGQELVWDEVMPWGN